MLRRYVWGYLNQGPYVPTTSSAPVVEIVEAVLDGHKCETVAQELLFQPLPDEWHRQQRGLHSVIGRARTSCICATANSFDRFRTHEDVVRQMVLVAEISNG